MELRDILIAFNIPAPFPLQQNHYIHFVASIHVRNFLVFQKNVQLFKVDWRAYTCLTQLYDGRDMYRIYYIKNNYMFRHFTLAVFRFIN